MKSADPENAPQATQPRTIRVRNVTDGTLRGNAGADALWRVWRLRASTQLPTFERWGPQAACYAVLMHVYERHELAQQLERLGVQRGGVLLVHTSFRAVRPILGGPRTLIDALSDVLGPEGTLVMPTMTDGETPFDPRSTPSVDMGIVAELFWREPGVHRSTHPGGSFAARGPRAALICAEQPLSPPHGADSPVGRVHALGGQVLLLGVRHSENTTLHLAEALAGVPYSVEHPCVVEVQGRFERVLIAETDHCCEGFERIDAWLRERGLEREGPVGHARARLVASTDVVAVAREALASDPLIFLCAAGAGCAECDRARASATQ